jgi:hypothetical protein
VAGSFYPEDSTALERAVAGLLAEVPTIPQGARAPKGLIVPHAGFVYSGPIAASAYARIAGLRDVIRRVVLLGPSHRVALAGVAAPTSDAFATPLGEVPVDRAAIDSILELPQVVLHDAAHESEHSLEVQLPFLQHLLLDFSLVPLAVGDATPDEVAEVIEKLWGGPETLIIISSDLSHYYDYETARRLDAQTSSAIESLDPVGLSRESACGRVPASGLLVAAKRHGLQVETLDLRNSGDTAGKKNEVVGYGAYLFSSPASKACDAGAATGVALLGVALQSIGHGLDSGRALEVDLNEYDPELRRQAATFVTLRCAKVLRGCVGSLEASLPLVADVARSAFRAAFQDTRFSPLTAAELEGLQIHISVLSPLEPLVAPDEASLLLQMRPGVDGLVLRDGPRQGTFLPAVWENLKDPKDFLRALKAKAGLPADAWSADWEVQRYTTQSFP